MALYTELNINSNFGKFSSFTKAVVRLNVLKTVHAANDFFEFVFGFWKDDRLEEDRLHYVRWGVARAHHSSGHLDAERDDRLVLDAVLRDRLLVVSEKFQFLSIFLFLIYEYYSRN